jgi:hypothetical protein
MKKTIIVFIILAFWQPTCHSQRIQKGRVIEKDSNGKLISNAEIIVKDAMPSISGDDGVFSLVFRNKMPGEIIFVEKVFKKGYEIVNISMLDEWIFSENKKFDIVLCKEGFLKLCREKYYNIGDSYYKKETNRLLRELEKAKTDGKMSEAEYNKNLNEIYKEKENKYKMLNNYTEVFSRINKDDLSKLEVKAFEFLEKGDIDGAITIYENEKLLNKFISNDSLMHSANAELEDMIPSLKRYAEICAFAGGHQNLQKASEILRLVAFSDTTKYANSLQYARSANMLGKISEADFFYQIAIRHSVNKLPILLEYGYLDNKNINYLIEGLDLLKKSGAKADSVFHVSEKLLKNIPSDDIRYKGCLSESIKLICDSLISANYNEYAVKLIFYLSCYANKTKLNDVEFNDLYNQYKPLFIKNRRLLLEYELAIWRARTEYYYNNDNERANEYQERCISALSELCRIDAGKYIGDFGYLLENFQNRFNKKYNISTLFNEILSQYSENKNLKEQMLICSEAAKVFSGLHDYEASLVFALKGIGNYNRIVTLNSADYLELLDILKNYENNARYFLKKNYIHQEEQPLKQDLQTALKISNFEEQSEFIVIKLSRLINYYVEYRKFDNITGVIKAVDSVFERYSLNRSFPFIMNLFVSEIFNFLVNIRMESPDYESFLNEISRISERVFDKIDYDNHWEILQNRKYINDKMCEIYDFLGKKELAVIYKKKSREIGRKLFLDNEEKYYRDYIDDILRIKEYVDFDEFISFFDEMVSEIDRKYAGNDSYKQIKLYIKYIMTLERGDYNYSQAHARRKSFFNRGPILCKNMGNNHSNDIISKPGFDKLMTAEGEYVNALRIITELHKNNHNGNLPQLIISLKKLNQAQKELKRFDKAEKNCLNILDIIYQNQKSTNENTIMYEAVCFNELALLNRGEKNYGKAISNYDKVERVYKTLSENKTDENSISAYAGILLEISLFYSDLKDFIQAESNCAVAIKVSQRLEEISPENFNNLYPLCLYCNSIICFENNRFEQADSILTELMNFYKNNYDTDPEKYDTLTATALGNLAIIKIYEKQFKKAEENIRSGLDIDSGQNWQKVYLAHALLFQGEYEKALGIYSELKDLSSSEGCYDEYINFILKNFDDFEKEKITNKDVSKIKKYLTQQE